MLTPMEAWKPIKHYETRYEVSDRGSIRSLSSSRLLTPGRQSKGYMTVCLYDGSRPKKGRSHTVHSLVLEVFVGPRPHGAVANHKNGIKADNRVENLEWITPRENIHHAMSTGLSIAHRRTAKLCWLDACAIRWENQLFAVPGNQLAQRYNVDRSSIYQILNGETYRSLAW